MFDNKIPDVVNVTGDIWLNETKKSLPFLKMAFEKLKDNEDSGEEAWKKLIDEAITNNDGEMAATLILYRNTVIEYADFCPKRQEIRQKRRLRHIEGESYESYEKVDNSVFYETVSKCCDKLVKTLGEDVTDYRFSHVLLVLEEKCYGLAIKDGETAMTTFLKTVNLLQDEKDAKLYKSIIDTIDSCCPQNADYGFKYDIVRYLYSVV